jgi:uncharacterized protein (TIGR02266 family)
MLQRVKDDPRVHPRYEIDSSAAISGGNHPIQNISLGGICIRTNRLQEVGAPVDVVLDLPQLGQRLELSGQVVWVNREPPEDVGIRWTNLDAERRVLLGDYINLLRQ